MPRKLAALMAVAGRDIPGRTGQRKRRLTTQTGCPKLVSLWFVKRCRGRTFWHIVVARVIDKDVFGNLDPCWPVKRPRGNRHAAFAIGLPEKACAAIAAKPANSL